MTMTTPLNINTDGLILASRFYGALYFCARFP